MKNLPGCSEAETAALVPPGTILLGFRGSFAYGMNQPDSDKDLIGVSIGTKKDYLGLLKTLEPKPFEKVSYGYDVVVYELKRFIKLCIAANPSILDLLWLNQNHYLHRSELGNELIHNRQRFITKKCYHSYTGYAYGQLYRLDHTAPTGRLGEKRKLLVEKFGFDTKNAAHAIRLLHMGIEILTDGVVNVDRSKKDAHYLLDIRAGKYSLDEIKTEAKRLLDLAEEAYVRSTLPSNVNFEEVEDWLIGLMESQEVQELWLTSSS